MGRHYNVAPRYTPGSPAMVDQATAERVAVQEKRSYLQSCSGVYGKGDQDTANEKGQDGIVELRVETQWGWLVEDLITGNRFMRPFACECWNKRRREGIHDRGCPAKRATSAAGKRRLERWRLTGR